MNLGRLINPVRRLFSNKFKAFLILFIVVLAVIAIGISPSLINKPPSEEGRGSGVSKWTCLFYFDGDNNLAEYNEMLTNLEFLQRAGSNDEVQLICLLDRDGANDSKVIHIKDSSLVEIPVSEVNPSWTDEVNMGDPETLTAMAKWTFTTYPAEHILILLSNHGGGWRGICWDDSSDGDNLDLEDLKLSLSDITTYFGRNIDVLATEACLVGMIEFVYPIQQYIDYFIGSQAYSFGAENTTDGGLVVGNWQYDLMWRELHESPEMTPKQFCEVIIKHFHPYGPWRAPPFIPKQESSDTLSVIDATQVRHVVKAVDKFGGALKAIFPIRRERVAGALQITEQFSGQFDFLGISSYTNIDLWDFADKISSMTALRDVRDSAAQVKTAVDTAVIFETHGSDPTQGDHRNAHGLSIYMPQRSSEYNEKYDTIDFAKDTQWDEFIKEYWLIPS